MTKETEKGKLSTVKVFQSLVEKLSYKQDTIIRVPLVNLTFWAGAGFSKAWDASAPTGSVLFDLSSKYLDKIADPLVFSRLFGLKSFSGIDMDGLRQIIYQLDMYERYPDISARYIDRSNIRIVRARLRAAILERYKELSEINFIDKNTAKFNCSKPTPSQSSILKMFRHIHNQSDGSESVVEGLRPHFVTTNYDFVIETILDNIIGPNDSLFLYTYRGVTPLNVSGNDNLVPIHQHWLTQHLIKLNGGFEITRGGNDYEFQYHERSEHEVVANPPVLMLPSREQSYSDQYFKDIFPKAVRLMRESAILVIVGYSLPDDDALMRFIIRQFSEEPEDARTKFIFYIDMNSEEDKVTKLRSVFPLFGDFQHRVFTYQGNFSDFAAEYINLLEK